MNKLEGRLGQNPRTKHAIKVNPNLSKFQIFKPSNFFL